VLRDVAGIDLRGLTCQGAPLEQACTLHDEEVPDEYF
jgi:hypothetical protein